MSAPPAVTGGAPITLTFILNPAVEGHDRPVNAVWAIDFGVDFSTLARPEGAAAHARGARVPPDAARRVGFEMPPGDGEVHDPPEKIEPVIGVAGRGAAELVEPALDPRGVDAVERPRSERGYRLDEGIGIALRKEDEALRLRLNRALRAILADGTYEKINARYFPFSIC